MSDRLTIGEVVEGLKDEETRKAITAELRSLWEGVPENDRKDFGQSVGVVFGSIFTRLWLRKLGATRLERYVATALISGVAVTNLRLLRIIKLLEAPPKPVNITNTFHKT